MATAAPIVDVTAETFQGEVIERSHQVPVLVDFWATWCGPCKTLLPMLERLAADYQGAFVLAKINVDEQQELAVNFGVRSVPTVRLFKDGAAVDEFAGALPEGELRAFLDQHIEREADRQFAAVAALLERGALDEAERELQALLDEPAMADEATILQAQLLHLRGDNRLALEQLAQLPHAIRESEACQQMQNAIELALAVGELPSREELADAVEKRPDESALRFDYASRLEAEGDYDTALVQLLELIRRDRGFNEGAAHQRILKIFLLLGEQDERVGHYRRQLASLLM